MSRSSREAAAANTSESRSQARQLLHAIADAGQLSATGLQLLVGPNGVLVSTEATQIDRSQPYAVDVLSIPEKSAAPVDGQSPVTIRPEEPVETAAYAPV